MSDRLVVSSFIGCASALVVLGLASGVLASDDASDERLGLRALAAVGYGTQNDSDAGAYGPAFGAKVGYSPVSVLHVAVQGTFHLGTRFGSEQNRVQLYGAEVGARLGPDWLTVVPYLAGGVALVQLQNNVDPFIVRGYAAAGGSLEVVPVEPLVVGVDVRLSLVPAGSEQLDNTGPTGTVDGLLLIGARY